MPETTYAEGDGEDSFENKRLRQTFVERCDGRLDGDATTVYFEGSASETPSIACTRIDHHIAG